MQRWALLAALLVMASPVTAQAPSALYMTDEAAGPDRLLSADIPEGDPATLQFSPIADLPANTYDWVTAEPEADDLLFTGAATVDLYFDTGLDAASKTTVSLLAVGDEERLLASAEDSTPGEIAPHQETFTLDLQGQTILEGETLVLRISVTENAAVVQLLYAGADTPSGITELQTDILDSDGDGVGDSAERRAGTDPTVPNNEASGNATNGGQEPASGNADPDQGTPPGDNTGPAGDDTGGNAAERSIEALTASFFLLFCLAVTGLALLRRFPL